MMLDRSTGLRTTSPVPIIVQVAWFLAMLGLHMPMCRGAERPEQVVFQGVDGRRFQVSGEGGRWLLVNYFATWCVPCIADIPELAALSAQDRGRLDVVGITDETLSPEAFRIFVASHPAPYPRLDVAAGSLPPKLPSRVLGLRMRPMNYLIRPDGSVAWHIVGSMDPAAIAFVRHTVAAATPAFPDRD